MSRGFTLVEILVTVGIFVLLIGAVTGFQKFVFSQNRLTQNDLLINQDARAALRALTAELRSARPGVTGAYPIAEAASSTLTFFSDVTGDGLPDQLRYFVAGGELRRGLSPAAGAPAGYATTSETVSVMARDLPPTAPAIFTYYDRNYAGTSTPLTAPVNIAAIRLIKATINSYTTQVVPRSLKDNL